VDELGKNDVSDWLVIDFEGTVNTFGVE